MFVDVLRSNLQVDEAGIDRPARAHAQAAG